jgi:hypothetical protein
LSAVPAFYANALVVLADPAFAALGVVITAFATMINAGFACGTILCRFAIYFLTSTAKASH